MSALIRIEALLAALVLTPAFAAVEDGRPAASMGEVKDHFARCLHLPDAAAASRPTFYFSLTRQGEVVAHPRIVLFGFEGSADARRRLIERISTAFTACLPLKLTRGMAASLPGKVYFLQYVVSARNQTTAVLFRPFGSHGGGGYSPLPLEPREDGFIPPSPPLALRPPPAPRRVVVPPARSLTSPEIFLAPKGRVIR